VATATAAGRGRSGPGPDLEHSAPTKTDLRRMRAEAGKADRERADAYERGRSDARAGHPRGHSAPLDDPHLEDIYDQGYSDAAAEKASKSPAGTPAAADNGADDDRPSGASPAPATPAPAGGSGLSMPKLEIADQGSSFLLGLVGYALVVSYFQYGWSGVTAWFSAKFTNKVPGKLGSQPGNAVLIPNANPGTGAPQAQSGGMLA
jgi:hypothetical protein